MKKRIRSKSINEEYWKEPCRDCGGAKEYGYRMSCRCSACTELLRKSKRTYEKKSSHGTGRKPTCSTCGQLKEPGRENESKCKSCKEMARKVRGEKKRADLGLRPWGSGRKETCCKCGKQKERIENGYCFACKNLLIREARLKQKSSPEFKDKERARATAKYKDSFSHKVKKLARLETFRAIKKGFLLKKPCEVCQSEKVDAHHDNYLEPLEVRWLCRLHHMEHHKNEKEKQNV